MTTTTTATTLPRREFTRPAAQGGEEVSNLLVLGGHTSDGQPSAGLYLWAATRVDGVLDTPVHRHEELEILTIDLAGSVGHYDTATDQWADLRAGDAQFIWAGPGISHRERVIDGRGFQIQFDPGHDIASRQQPSYANFRRESFTQSQVDKSRATVTDLVGGDGPIHARTEGLAVRRLSVPAGSSATLAVGSGRFTLAYMIDGAATVNGAQLGSDDPVTLNGAESMTVEAIPSADVFLVSLPANPSYKPRSADPQQVGGQRSGPPWEHRE